VDPQKYLCSFFARFQSFIERKLFASGLLYIELYSSTMTAIFKIFKLNGKRKKYVMLQYFYFNYQVYFLCHFL